MSRRRPSRSGDVWDRTHRLGGRLFKLTAVVALLALAFGDDAVSFLVVPALVTAAVTVVLLLSVRATGGAIGVGGRRLRRGET